MALQIPEWGFCTNNLSSGILTKPPSISYIQEALYVHSETPESPYTQNPKPEPLNPASPGILSSVILHTSSSHLRPEAATQRSPYINSSMFAP